jgi:hypothetical protein
MLMQAILTEILMIDPDLQSSPVESVARMNKVLFILFIVAQVAAIILSALIWQSGNKYQEAVVANAREDAKTESKRIETESNEQIAKVQSDAEIKINEAKQKASEANERAGNASQRAEEIARENIILQASVEKEKATRLELEKSLAPREIVMHTGGGKATSDPLKPYAGIHVILHILPDAEADRAARSIEMMTKFAGWEITEKAYKPELNAGIYDGVAIEPYLAYTESHPNPTIEEQKAHNFSMEAAGALVDFLRAHNWQAHIQPPMLNVPQNTLRINIGFKTSPYFVAPEFKEMNQWMQKLEEESRRTYKEAQERQKAYQKEYEQHLRQQKPQN